jgi:hypothetical protein
MLLYNINRSVFVAETQCVFCGVETKFSNIIEMRFRVKGIQTVTVTVTLTVTVI